MVSRIQLVALAIAVSAVGATAIGVQLLGPKDTPTSIAPAGSQESGASSGTVPSIDVVATETSSAGAAIDASDLPRADTATATADPVPQKSTAPSAEETAELSPRPSSEAAEEEVVAQPILEPSASQSELTDEQASVVVADLEREQVGDLNTEADRATVESAPLPTEAPVLSTAPIPATETAEVEGDPAAGELEEPSATSQTLMTAKGEPTVDDDLTALKGRSADPPIAGEPAVTTVAQGVAASPTEADAAIVDVTDAPPAAEPDEAIGQLTEPEGDALEPVDAGGELATADADSIEPAAAPVLGDLTLPVDVSLVHFDLSSSYLSPGAVMMVDRAAAALDGLESTFSVEIKGFTDTVGSDEFNLWLAERRVNRVIDALVDRGIPRENLIASPRGPFGAPIPTGDNVSEPLNRCVAVTLVEVQ